MTLLQLLCIFASICFLCYSFDLKRRKKIGLFSFLVILLGALVVLVMSFNLERFNEFAAFFGLHRAAELVVYCAIIFLGFAYLHLINATHKSDSEFTRFISQSAIQQCFQANKDKIQTFQTLSEKDEYLVHMRVYNEELKLKEQIESVITYGYKKILLINDGSRDRSQEIIEEVQAEHPECLILCCTHTINRGGGAANKTGFAFVKQYGDLLNIKYVVTFDSDGQMDIRDMDTFTQAIKENKKNKKKPDLYVGSRFIGGMDNSTMPISRKRILMLSRLVTRIFYHIKVSDPHNGYRVRPLETFKKINLQADDMHYANEINEQIHELGLTFQEIPVHITYTDYSLGKGQKNSNSIKLGIEMFYKKFFFK